MLANRPVLDSMLRWLQSEQVLLPDGAVLSWHNLDHPGYVYPEAGGLLLSLLASESVAQNPASTRIACRLASDVSPAGGVGRNGHEYLFDTAIVLSGLLAYERAGGVLGDRFLPQRLFNFVVRHIEQRCATRVPICDDSLRWSASYGCHQLKTALAIGAYWDRTADARCPLLIKQLVHDLIPLGTDGRFHIHAHSRATYLHAACYAVEGLLAAWRYGWADVEATVRASADWFASVQYPHGGLRAWHDGIHAYGEYRADVTAQAVRIWLCVDRIRFASAIDRGLTFLAQLQAPSGGIRYHPGGADINTWSTIFTVQAMYWSAKEGDGRRIV